MRRRCHAGWQMSGGCQSYNDGDYSERKHNSFLNQMKCGETGKTVLLCSTLVWNSLATDPSWGFHAVSVASFFWSALKTGLWSLRFVSIYIYETGRKLPKFFTKYFDDWWIGLFYGNRRKENIWLHLLKCEYLWVVHRTRVSSQALGNTVRHFSDIFRPNAWWNYEAVKIIVPWSPCCWIWLYSW